MFDCTNANSPMVTKGEIHQLIIEFGETPNADIQYKEGYLDADGNFVPLGINKFHAQDKEEEVDTDGNVTQEASTDFTDLLSVVTSTMDLVSDLETYLAGRL